MAIEIHFEKRINNSAVVRDVDPRQQRNHMFAMLLAVLFLLGLLFYGWQQYRYLDAGYVLSRARVAHQKLTEANARLTVHRDSMGSLTRIAAKAKALGMIEPAPGQWLTLNPEPVADPSAANAPKLALAAEE